MKMSWYTSGFIGYFSIRLVNFVILGYIREEDFVKSWSAEKWPIQFFQEGFNRSIWELFDASGFEKKVSLTVGQN